MLIERSNRCFTIPIHSAAADNMSASMDATNSTLASPLKEFTVFTRLPVELRIAIWRASMEPRVVEVNYEPPDGFFSRAPYPEALGACRESRAALESQYHLCFGNIFHPPKTRFNFALDTLYFDSEMEEEVPHLFATFRPFELQKLKYMAIDSYFHGYQDDDDEEFKKLLRSAMTHLQSLKSLQIVYDIHTLSNHSFGCERDQHAMQIYETLPKELQQPRFKIADLPGTGDDDGDLLQLDSWPVKEVSRVYGWRRCPQGVPSEDGMRDRLYPWDTPYEDDSWASVTDEDSEYDSYDDHESDNGQDPPSLADFFRTVFFYHARLNYQAQTVVSAANPTASAEIDLDSLMEDVD